MTREQAWAIRAKVVDGETVANLGGFTTDVSISDKLGQNWKTTYLNGVVVMREYVQQEVPVGTADNPIQWYDGVPLIDNAYYIKDGVRVVCMSGEFVEF